MDFKLNRQLAETSSLLDIISSWGHYLAAVSYLSLLTPISMSIQSVVDEYELGGDTANRKRETTKILGKSGLDSHSATTDNGVVENAMPQGYGLPAPNSTYTSMNVSPEERKVQMKTELKGFCTLLLFIFLEGWNDGTLGLLSVSD